MYLLLTLGEKELESEQLLHYCPTRRHSDGRKPNLTGQAPRNKEKREETWNIPDAKNVPEGVVKRMLAKAIEVGVKAVMGGHVYKFNGEIKHQKEGGAIGLELTGEIAGVFMSWWDKCLRRKLREDGISIVVYKRYVDDINTVVSMKTRTDTEVSDKDVIERIKAIGNGIHPSIQLEADYPSKYEDHKVPILDVKVWIDAENRILHEYYSKPVSFKAVIDRRSAMPLKDKRTVLTQDILRIVLRCSPLLPWEKVVEHIEVYMLRLQFSGYDQKFREEVLRSALQAHENIKKAVDKGKRPLYRSKMWRKNERAREKRGKKTSWYKKKLSEKEGEEVEKDKQYKSVLFVQPTRGSKLKKLYEEAVSKSKCEVKVVERAGVNVRNKLQKSYPFELEKCGCEDCFVCESGGKGNCKRDNVTYEVVCERDGCNHVYIGESCRNAYSRGREHLDGLTKKRENSVFYKHIKENHVGTITNTTCHGFRMNVTKCHTTAMSRQITEGVRIENSSRPLLNSKKGYRANNLLRLRASLTDV